MDTHGSHVWLVLPRLFAFHRERITIYGKATEAMITPSARLPLSSLDPSEPMSSVILGEALDRESMSAEDTQGILAKTREIFAQDVGLPGYQEVQQQALINFAKGLAVSSANIPGTVQQAIQTKKDGLMRDIEERRRQGEKKRRLRGPALFHFRERSHS